MPDVFTVTRIIGELEDIQKQMMTKHQEMAEIQKKYFEIIEQNFGMKPQEIQGCDVPKLLRASIK